MYTLFRTERTKTTPCPAAYPRIGHIRENPPRGSGEIISTHTEKRAIQLKGPRPGENVKRKSERKPKKVGEAEGGGRNER